MAFRPGLLPLLRTGAPRTVPSTRGFHYLSQQPGTSAARTALRAKQQPQVITRSLPRNSSAANANSLGVRAALALGLGLTAFSFARPAQLDSTIPTQIPNPNVVVVNERARIDPPQSIVSLPQLTFGATCGICAGVFVKKGFKLVAFALGGIFVLLQYLSSRRFVTVDWSAVSKSYDGAFAAVDADGVVHYPTVTGTVNRLVDFLTANFQQRATFVAGFILGLRVG